MLITVPIEELQSGDILQPDNDVTTFGIVRDAMAVPTRTERTDTLLKLQQEARRVENPGKVGRLYASVTMGTYAVVSRRKGTPVCVDRKGPTEPQDVYPAVVEHTPECASYLSDDVTGESYVCDCSVGRQVADRTD